jgi:hypothetical protein
MRTAEITSYQIISGRTGSAIPRSSDENCKPCIAVDAAKANEKYDSIIETIRTGPNPSLARDECGGFRFGRPRSVTLSDATRVAAAILYLMD